MVLFIPDVYARENEHSGFGHIIRALRTAYILGGDILLSESEETLVRPLLDRFFSQNRDAKKKIRIVREPMALYDAVVVDKRVITQEYAHDLSYLGLTIGIDVGGEGRSMLSYVIDTLPNQLQEAPNIYLHKGSFTPYLPTRTHWASSCKAIFYYSNDAVTPQELIFLEEVLSLPEVSMQVVSSHKEGYSELAKSYNNVVVSDIDFYMMETIAQFDLCITHFGILALEAVSAKVPVVLLNKSSYHNVLSTLAGFPYIFSDISQSQKRLFANTREKVYGLLSKQVIRWVTDDTSYAKCIEETSNILHYDELVSSDVVNGMSDTIETLISDYKKTGSDLPINPWIGIVPAKSVFRNKERTVFQCPHTSQYYQIPFSSTFPKYTRDYFFEEYQLQYGKTYIEDFNFILGNMRTRINIMHGYLPSHLKRSSTKGVYQNTSEEKSAMNPIICDIGSAYGAMLQAISERGYQELGLEINKEAIKYCKKILEKMVVQHDLSQESIESACQKAKLSQSHIVAITAFFVLEHFSDIQRILQEIKDILPIGGMFVCAVPNGKGISIRKNRNEFFSASPIDHFSVFTPQGLTSILEKVGFRIRKTRITGHHPERIGTSSLLKNSYMRASKLLRLGDTFEVYAQRYW